MSTFIKKFVSILLLLALILGVIAIAGAPQTQAVGWGDVEDLFQAGDEGLSFTQYEGGLATLSEDGYDASLTESNDLREFILKIVNFALGFLGLIAVVIIIYGGVLYVTAAGDTEKTDKGKKAILYATVGLLIVLGSFAFVNTVIEGAGGDGGTGTTQQYVVGANQGGSFNAAAAQVKTLAREIYTGFITFGESMEELRGISSDLDKASLKYNNTLVAKEDMLAFLFNLKEKLTNMRAKVTQFSQTYIAINELSRYVDGRIDLIQSLNKTIFAKGSGKNEITICEGNGDPGAPEDSGKVVQPKTNGITIVKGTFVLPGILSCNNDEFSKYQEGLFEAWAVQGNDRDEPIVPNLTSNQVTSKNSLASLVEPIKTDYLRQLMSIFPQLEEIKNQIVGIKAAETNLVGENGLYDQMMALYGYLPEHAQKDLEDITFPQESFLGMIQGWEMDFKPSDDDGDTSSGNFDNTGNQLFAALEKHMEFQKELLKLRSVIARLRANVVTGNAPMVVTFDVLETIDPAGGSIVDENINWKGITGKVGTDGKEISYEDPELGVQCNNVDTPLNAQNPPDDSQNDQLFGSAFRQCTFNQPGTYTVTVEIESNDPTKYVSGRSSLTIKVLPPNTQIKMNLKAGDKTIQIIDYYDNGVLKLNKNYVPVTLFEAKAGINFNASATENVEKFTWDFGDGTPLVEGANPVSHPYLTEGKYKVVLEVINKLNQLDRKIFTLDVRSLATRIKVTPEQNIFINQPVKIDAELSSSSGGQIKDYDWTITKRTNAGSTVIAMSNPDGGQTNLGNKSTFNFQFKDPGKYIVDLKATNDVETSSAEPVEINVKSKNPVAKFEHSIPKQNQPSTVHFKGSSSFDPDGSVENLQYEWKITPASENGSNWSLVDQNGIAIAIPPNGTVTDRDPIIKFKKKTDFDVTLKVTDTRTINSDIPEESGSVSKKIAIDNILDVDWGVDQLTTGMLNEQGRASMDFDIVSENAVAYEIDFGDGESDSGDIDNEAIVPHVYNKSGKYDVTVTVYDADDDDNSIKRRFFIGGGEKPLARATLLVNGSEIFNFEDPITVGMKDSLVFDAGQSINMDGTGRDLRYTWDFGDMENSSQERATHKYKDVSPLDIGYYTVKLTVADKKDPSKFDSDEIKINVVNRPPHFSDVQALLSQSRKDMITPVEVDMRVYGAEDPDGQIVQYKWWYFDADDPSEELGIQITREPVAKLTIGTRGPEGQEVTYGFGLEVTDNSDLTYSNQDQIDEGDFPDIKVKNGKNTLPVAKFDASTTSASVGDTIRFTSSSTDEDGEIETYIWDFEGDGFFNNEPTEDAAVEHIYDKKNKEGYLVKLKVIDDKGGETTSESIKVSVDSTAQPPTAAFTYKVIDGSKGMKIQFNDKSTVPNDDDSSIIGYRWDFDAAPNSETADTNGDGTKDNDVESSDRNPTRLYTKAAIYKVKLTVTDNQGNVDEVINDVKIPLADPPIAAFTSKVIDGKVAFQNNSTPDPNSDATLEKYIWDFDVDSELVSADSDGDGESDNDNDSELLNPVFQYEQPGTYNVKLIVIDSQGNRDEVTHEVVAGRAPATGATLGGSTTTTGGSTGTSSPAAGASSGTGTSTGTQPGSSPAQPASSQNLRAVLQTTPVPAADGVIYLPGITGSIRFVFSSSLGNIASYTIDKNTLFDTDGNGVADDDKDFQSNLAGAWTTNFEKAWGRIVVRLTVKDSQGNQDTEDIEIKFQ